LTLQVGGGREEATQGHEMLVWGGGASQGTGGGGKGKGKGKGEGEGEGEGGGEGGGKNRRGQGKIRGTTSHAPVAHCQPRWRIRASPRWGENARRKHRHTQQNRHTRSRFPPPPRQHTHKRMHSQHPLTHRLWSWNSQSSKSHCMSWGASSSSASSSASRVSRSRPFRCGRRAPARPQHTNQHATQQRVAPKESVPEKKPGGGNTDRPTQ
jgi:hypothetical protein